MVSRSLAVCLALVLSNAAYAAESGDPAGSANGASDQSVEQTVRPRRKMVARRLTAVLPPSRPAELTGTDVAHADGVVTMAAVVDGAASPVLTPSHDAAVRLAATAPATTMATVAVLPPLRPSLPAEPAPATSLSASEDVSEATSRVAGVLPPARPAFQSDGQQVASAAPEPATPLVASAPEPAAAVPAEPSLFAKLFGSTITAAPSLLPGIAGRGHNGIDGLVTTYARLNGVPEALVHRVIIRESKYNPRAVGHGGALGLMQIKHGTARALGYDGPASGLLDAETNITYAVKYLAGAYRTAGGDFDRAVQYYARGYYFAAKAQRGGTRMARRGRRGDTQEAEARSDDGQRLAAAETQ